MAADEIRPIETAYKGYKFRSRLEARWAVFFDELAIRYDYEAEGYDLGNLGWYLPDFYLPEYKTFLEVKADKGNMPREPISFYFAGKMCQEKDWRKDLITGPNKTICGQYYTGNSANHKPETIVPNELHYVKEADVVFAWLPSPKDIEVFCISGYARGMLKPIYLAVPRNNDPSNLDDWADPHNNTLWFLYHTVDDVVLADTPREGFLRVISLLNLFNEDDKKCIKLSTMGDNVIILRGTPPSEYEVEMGLAPYCNLYQSGKCIEYGSSLPDLFSLLNKSLTYSANDLELAYSKARRERFEK